jgi:Protein of unknown function (DUF1559)
VTDKEQTMTRLLTVTAAYRAARLLLAAASFSFLAAPVLADKQPALKDLTKTISSFVDAQTIAVAHVRLDKVDVGRLVQLAGKVFDLPAGEAAVAELAGKLAVASLVSAGAREVYVIISLDGFPYEMALLVIPTAGEAESKRITAALKLTMKLREAPDETTWGELLIQRDKNFVLIAPKNSLKRLRTMRPVLPPNLEKALAAFPPADARLAIVLPDALRRSLGELIPQLPRELGAGKMAPLLDGFQFAAVGIGFAPKLSTEAMLLTGDEKTAAAMRTLLGDLMGLAAREIAQDAGDLKLLLPLARIMSMLTPHADKEVLTWKLTEDEWIQAIRPLAEQIKARGGSAQAMNNLKQIGLAMHNYHSIHKHFPTGIRDKQGKLLLSWRVQILPYVEGGHLYEQFKLDEAWDSPHNIKLVKQMPAVFRGPNSKADAGKSNFLLPSGKGLFFDTTVTERKIQDMTDGTSNTIMVLEVDDDHAVTWTRPVDLNVDVKQPLKGLGGNPAGKILALFADGSVRTFNRKIVPADFYTFLTIAGGEVVPLP